MRSPLGGKSASGRLSVPGSLGLSSQNNEVGFGNDFLDGVSLSSISFKFSTGFVGVIVEIAESKRIYQMLTYHALSNFVGSGIPRQLHIWRKFKNH